MKHLFEVAAGSVPGTNHSRVGKNNQDAFSWESHDQYTLAVVCDGCGSRLHSEVGATLGARLTLSAVAQQWLKVTASETLPALPEFWPQVQSDLLSRLQHVISSLGGDPWETVQNYLLFTILGVFMTPDTTTVFGVGDGLFVVNGTVHTLGPFAHNAPPYLAYGLAPPGQLTLGPEMTTLQVYQQVPTPEIESLLLGTDGVLDLINRAAVPLPGKPTVLGDLQQFWQDDSYFNNPDRVRRQLALANREVIQPDWPRQQLTRQPGLLPDDTTLVSIRRKRVTQGESLECLSQSTKN
jgi:hypothetical protein